MFGTNVNFRHMKKRELLTLTSDRVEYVSESFVDFK